MTPDEKYRVPEGSYAPFKAGVRTYENADKETTYAHVDEYGTVTLTVELFEQLYEQLGYKRVE